MTNKILLAAVILLAAITTSAQDFTVYSVIGEAKIVKGNEVMPLLPRKQVDSQTLIRIEPESAVIILDEKKGKMYAFSAKGVSTVGRLVESAGKNAKSLTRQYMSYLVKQLFDNDNEKLVHADTYMQVTATAYRSATNDSMLVDRLAHHLALPGGTTVEQALCSPQEQLRSDFDVNFQLVSYDTALAVDNSVARNTACYARVCNNTSELLYVNILNIDEKGNKYLVLPVDSAATCRSLLMPPFSTISFKQEPFIFSEENANETFVLIATQEPVDFSILMNPIVPTTSGRSKMQAGLCKRIFHVEK